MGAAAWGLAWVVEILQGWVGVPLEEQAFFLEVLDEGGSAVLLFVPFAVVLAPLGEELFFRGFAFAHLLRERGPVVAHALSAFLFAAIHLNPSGFPVYLLLAVVFAWSYRRFGSILVPIVAHGVNNAVTLALYLA